MNTKVVPFVKFVAIQQIMGSQPTAFMKLARHYSREEIERLPGSARPFLELDKEWMLNNGFSPAHVENHCATSQVVGVDTSSKGVLMVKTARSTYQVIPGF